MSREEMFEGQEGADQEKDGALVEIKVESHDLVVKAQNMAIKTQEGYVGGAEFLKSLKSLQKKASDFFSPIVSKAYDTWKTAKAKENEVIDPLKKAESLVKNKMIEYDAEQRRIAEEAQRKADEDARKAQEKITAKADKAAESGDLEKAQALRQQAASAPVPIIEKSTPKVAGIKSRENWEFEIVDIYKVPIEYLLVDESKVKKAVNIFKKTDAIPGIRAYRKDIVSASGA